MAAVWHAFFDPRVTSHLIADEGEIIIDEVRRHAMAFVLPILIMVLGLLIMILTFLVPLEIAWLPFAIGLLLIIIGGYKVLAAHMDRFVITNMRVFRVNGIFAQHTATMPMSRILDISVHKPLIGRIFSYGHFVFESAAQDQGLRDIRFVGHPDERDLTIQRVIQRSGLRSSMRPLHESDDLVGPTRRGGRDRDEDAEDYDPTDGSPTPDDDAAWLAEGWPQDASGERWRPDSWTERDQAEHDQARRHVRESEEVGVRTRLSQRFGLSGPGDAANPPVVAPEPERTPTGVPAGEAAKPISEPSDTAETPLSAASSDPIEDDESSRTGRS